MDPVSHTVINLIIFVLAIYVGYHVVWTVTPARPTPLVAVPHAIPASVIAGALPAAAPPPRVVAVPGPGPRHPW